MAVPHGFAVGVCHASFELGVLREKWVPVIFPASDYDLGDPSVDEAGVYREFLVVPRVAYWGVHPAYVVDGVQECYVEEFEEGLHEIVPDGDLRCAEGSGEAVNPHGESPVV